MSVTKIATRHEFERPKGVVFRCKHCKLSVASPAEERNLSDQPCAETRKQMGWDDE